MSDKEIITDQTLATALELLCDYETACYEQKAIEEPHTPSAAFLERINRLFTAHEKHRILIRRWKRAAVVFALIAILLFSVVMGVSGWRKEFFRIVEKSYHDFINVAIEETPDTPPQNDAFVEYELGAIPDGFIKVMDFTDPIAREKSVKYESGDSYIIFRQSQALDMDFYINIGSDRISYVYDYGIEYHFFSNDEVNNYYWNDEEYVLLIAGNIDKDQLLELAKSTKIKVNRQKMRFY